MPLLPLPTADQAFRAPTLFNPSPTPNVKFFISQLLIKPEADGRVARGDRTQERERNLRKEKREKGATVIGSHPPLPKYNLIQLINLMPNVSKF